MSIETTYKLIDKFEMMLLKAIPIPFSPFVIIDRTKAIDLFQTIMNQVPEEIRSIMIFDGMQIPYSPFIIVNHEKIIDMLDKIRSGIPRVLQEQGL